MQSFHFIVAAPSRVKRSVACLPEADQAAIRWSYFGTDMNRRERATACLPPSSRIGLADDLSATGRRLRQPFLDWVVELTKRQRDPLIWWSSGLASKDLLQTDFFHLLCFYAVIRQWLEQTPHDAPRLLIVEDAWLQQLLAGEFAGRRGVRFECPGWNRALASTYWGVRGPLAALYSALHHLWGKRLATRHFPENRSCDAQTLLFTFIDDGCFRSGGDSFKDYVTGRLGDLLAKTGRRVKRFTVPNLRADYLKKLRPLAPAFLMISHWLRWADIVGATRCRFRIDDLENAPPIAGLDCRVLLRREVARTNGHAGFFTYLIFYQALRRAIREDRFLEDVVYPFENQRLEKVICLAVRAEAPKVRTIGYLHSSAAPLNYYFGRGELETAPLPDRVATSGAPATAMLRARGFPPDRLFDAGALRFEQFFSPIGCGERSNDRPLKRVLVALPIVEFQAKALLSDLADLLPEPFLGRAGGERLEFVVKCHPSAPLQRLGKRPDDYPRWFTFSERSLSELLVDADLFLFAPPTAAWRDAYLAGVPILRYRDDLLDLEEPDDARIAFQACSRADLRPKMAEALKRGVVSRSASAWTERLGHLFSPVNETIWSELLSLPSTSIGAPPVSPALDGAA